MRSAWLTCVLALAACAPGPEQALYSCASGPDLAILYDEDRADILLPDGRTLSLVRPDPARENHYAGDSATWSRGWREGRLDFEGRSLLCDQYGG